MKTDSALTGIEIELPHETSLEQTVQHLKSKFITHWWENSPSLPDLGRSFTLNEQLKREKEFEEFLKDLNQILTNLAPEPAARLEAQDRLYQICGEIAKSVFGLEDRHLESIRSCQFAEALGEFIQMARRFDSGASDADIYQAGRNVWSMNFIQLLLGLPVQITPAVFAYSMLYPYTDNLLDDPSLTIKSKQEFNHRFNLRLEGETIPPASPMEERIWDLVSMVEHQYSRSGYPQVFKSLLAIYHAQTKSMKLLQGNGSPYEVDILGICFEKGGTSVLADGYLVAGDLTFAQQELMFAYGTLTQLVDDLEDTQSDLRSNLMTVFSSTARFWKLDKVTNLTLHYADKMLTYLEAQAGPEKAVLMDALRRSLIPLMVGEAGSVRSYYSKAYLKELQAHFPYRFPFLERQRKRLEKKGYSLMSLGRVFVPPE
jgi:hypothetical protein